MRWLLRGAKHNDFGGHSSRSQEDDRKVDHGAKGHPDILDWKKLGSVTCSAVSISGRSAEDHAKGILNE